MSGTHLGQAVKRFVHPLYKKLETDVHPLRYLFLEITQRCNLSCLHCGSDCTANTQYDELTTQEWLDFFDYIPKHYDVEKLMLVVTGGEPLVAKDLDVLLAGLKRNKLHWGMVSNGFLLSQKNIDKAVDHGLMSLTVSVDGLEAEHDWLRNVPTSFQRATQGLRRAVQKGIPFLDVVTCVNPRNLGQLDEIRKMIIDLGVPAWRLFSIAPIGRAATDPELMLTDAQLRQLMDWIAETRAKYGDDELQMEFSCEGYVPGERDKQIRQEPYFCRAGVSIGSVLCDGSISACPNIPRELVQGNIRQNDFAEVWEQRFQKFRDRAWMQQGPCKDCSEWNQCQGNSMHLWSPEQQQTARCFVKALDA